MEAYDDIDLNAYYSDEEIKEETSDALHVHGEKRSRAENAESDVLQHVQKKIKLETSNQKTFTEQVKNNPTSTLGLAISSSSRKNSHTENTTISVNISQNLDQYLQQFNLKISEPQYGPCLSGGHQATISLLIPEINSKPFVAIGQGANKKDAKRSAYAKMNEMIRKIDLTPRKENMKIETKESPVEYTDKNHPFSLLMQYMRNRFDKNVDIKEVQQGEPGRMLFICKISVLNPIDSSDVTDEVSHSNKKEAKRLASAKVMQKLLELDPYAFETKKDRKKRLENVESSPPRDVKTVMTEESNSAIVSGEFQQYLNKNPILVLKTFIQYQFQVDKHEISDYLLCTHKKLEMNSKLCLCCYEIPKLEIKEEGTGLCTLSAEISAAENVIETLKQNKYFPPSKDFANKSQLIQISDIYPNMLDYSKRDVQYRYLFTRFYVLNYDVVSSDLMNRTNMKKSSLEKLLFRSYQRLEEYNARTEVRSSSRFHKNEIERAKRTLRFFYSTKTFEEDCLDTKLPGIYSDQKGIFIPCYSPLEQIVGGAMYSITAKKRSLNWFTGNIASGGYPSVLLNGEYPLFCWFEKANQESSDNYKQREDNQLEMFFQNYMKRMNTSIVGLCHEPIIALSAANFWRLNMIATISSFSSFIDSKNTLLDYLQESKANTVVFFDNHYDKARVKLVMDLCGTALLLKKHNYKMEVAMFESSKENASVEIFLRNNPDGSTFKLVDVAQYLHEQSDWLKKMIQKEYGSDVIERLETIIRPEDVLLDADFL